MSSVAGQINGGAVTFREALIVWLRVAALSFGGPAGQIAVMHRILVEEKKWLSEGRFLHALNYCMVLPGPEAQQLATYIGWLLHGTRGGLTAGILFVLPGFVSILILSLTYAGLRDLALVEGLFFGIQAAVLAIVIQAVVRIGKRALKNTYMYALAAAGFVAIFFLTLPFPLVIVAAAIFGLLGQRFDPKRFAPAIGHGESGGGRDRIDAAPTPRHRTLRRAVGVASIWLLLWFVPLFVLLAVFGVDNVFTQIGLFFSKLAVVSFGGAYSVLAYMAQAAVEQYGWIQPGEMLDGLGMAETTPGPLIQVVQFVAFMAAFRDAGGLNPFSAGIAASVLATWVTFVPCFLWIFLGAPFVETLRNNAAVSAALSAITAAVVGVMLNLAIWLAIHVLFADVREQRYLGIRWLIPDAGSAQWPSIAFAAVAFVAIFRYKIGILPVIAASAILGAVYVALASF